MIQRPDLKFDPKTHRYTLDGQELLSISSISKVGEDSWGPASAWGWKVGYEGAYEAMEYAEVDSKPALREKLKDLHLTPWSQRNKAARRGTWVHDVLQKFIQSEEVSPDPFPEETEEYVRAVMRWYLDYAPQFLATEVQVASKRLGFAGRFDLLCTSRSERWLIDLKTSKRVYPESHFVQLAGYELGAQEIGYPPTDAQYILLAKADGTYSFEKSCARGEHFEAYLSAARARQEIKELMRGDH